MLVASHVVFERLPVNHVSLLTDQSSEIRPHVCAGSNQDGELGWITLDIVKFQLGVHVGGGHTPDSAHVGDTGAGVGDGGGGGGGGAHPPGGSEQCATAAIDLTVPGHGSARPADVTTQDALPTHAAVTIAGKPLSLQDGDGAKVGQSPVGVPKSALTESMTPFSQVRFVVTVFRI